MAGSPSDSASRASEPSTWLGPPPNFVGVAVPLNLILGRSVSAAILAPIATVYLSGWEIEISVRSPGTDSALTRIQTLLDRQSPDRSLSPIIGVEYSDGRRADNLEALSNAVWEKAQAFDRLTMLPTGGGGDRFSLDASAWIPAIPPDGKLTLFCEWSEQGIPHTRTELDASVIRGIRQQAIQLWPLDEASAPAGNRLWTTIVS